MRPGRDSEQAARERGSATVLAVGTVGALAALFLAAALLAAATVARNHAQTAADLGAVAGAQVLVGGWSEPRVCARAARFVTNNHARMHRCYLVDEASASTVSVVVEVRRPVLTSTSWVARARGRAGLVPR
ncbi:MAG TPA: Rv3654c family TadE-like protein [Ornithinimicrobium sp.]|uniref:Rv3654c family TadE-like protein n=1 Tax=Ornithinimicrobium sp. TaxID=1977084 RepID=UPI002B4A7C18|nr:Rv3654c family TadE-like protein [Ornithinimicrobium sp.]HKJ12374.1 Rv3654c family TadE-like protein [Ornithinimicrobium sp.]